MNNQDKNTYVKQQITNALLELLKEKELSEKKVKLENERQELTKKVNTLSYSLAGFKSEGVDIEKDTLGITDIAAIEQRRV